ncbi:MAG: type VI secretion system tip protein TssI/VgrG [Planctomycetota bacterium]
MPYTHEGRLASIATPLGDDVLLLSKVEGFEGLSRLFQLDALVLAEGEPIDPSQLIGQNVTIALDLESGQERRFLNGMVARLGQGGADERFITYRLTIVPFVWLLTQRRDCRIYQHLSVTGIAEQIFEELGVRDFELRLSGSPPEREYVVQYRETYWDFLARLFEDEGLFYFFEHQDGKHVLVIADQPWQPAAFAKDPLVFYKAGLASKEAPEALSEWDVERSVTSGLFSLTSFDFEQPRLDLEVSSQAHTFDIEAELEVYDTSPADYKSVARGDEIALIRLEEAAASRTVIRSRSRNRGLRVASTFRLSGHYDAAFDEKDFLITEQRFQIDQSDSFQPGAPAEAIYESRFHCIPKDVPYRPPRTTTKPRIVGPQSATVVGPDGEEIHVDSLGRVNVLFHWDRLGAGDDSSSCPVRVSQAWAGKGFGTWHLPRIGQEVIVEFLEGDPDCPLITGSVYNGVQKPPYDPAAQPTVSTWKSSTSKGGQGFNEIRFDDKKDNEQIFIHAQKDAHLRVGNDRVEHVEQDHHRRVVRNEKVMVEGDRHHHVKGDRLEKVASNFGLEVEGDRLAKVTGNDHKEVGGDAISQIEGECSFTVTGDLLGKATGDIAFDGKDVHIKAGANAVIEAATQLTLKVGGNFIVISSSGIDIQGSMLKLNSGGSAGSGAGCSPGKPTAPDSPEEPLAAIEGEPGEVSEAEAEPGAVNGSVANSTPATQKQARVLQEAADSGAPFCEKCEEARKKKEGGGS